MWFGPYLDYLEAARDTNRTQGERVAFAAPPQHGKTECIKHALAWGLCFSDRRNAYLTYSADRAQKEVAYDVRIIAERMGVSVTGSLDLLRGPRGGSCKFVGVGGSFTGAPVDGMLAIDDPIKGDDEARSRLHRDKLHRWLHSVALRRVHMGASVFLMATRWHVDDLTAREVAAGWRYINLPAVCDTDDDPLGRMIGDPLAPGRFTGEALAAMRQEMGEYIWAAQYQGRPQPVGAAVFADPTFYERLPDNGYQVGYGLDLSYTAKTHADYSVLITGRAVPCTVMVDGKPRRRIRLYIEDVVRRQCEAPAFAVVVKERLSLRRGRIMWYASGTEKGTAQFFRVEGIPLIVRNASQDKYLRAQPTSAAWNRGDILVPRDAPWLVEFLREVAEFTGVNDAHDDQVDALAALFDLLAAGSSGGGGAAINDDFSREAA